MYFFQLYDWVYRPTRQSYKDSLPEMTCIKCDFITRFYYLPCVCAGVGVGGWVLRLPVSRSQGHTLHISRVCPHTTNVMHERMCNTCAANNCWTAMHEAVAEHGIAPGIVCSAIRSVPVAAPSVVSPAFCDPRAVITVSERTRARRATAVGNSAKLHHHTCVCHHRAHLLCERARTHRLRRAPCCQRAGDRRPTTVAVAVALAYRMCLAVWFVLHGCVCTYSRIHHVHIHIQTNAHTHTHTRKQSKNGGTCANARIAFVLVLQTHCVTIFCCGWARGPRARLRTFIVFSAPVFGLCNFT